MLIKRLNFLHPHFPLFEFQSLLPLLLMSLSFPGFVRFLFLGSQVPGGLFFAFAIGLDSRTLAQPGPQGTNPNFCVFPVSPLVPENPKKPKPVSSCFFGFASVLPLRGCYFPPFVGLFFGDAISGPRTHHTSNSTVFVRVICFL